MRKDCKVCGSLNRSSRHRMSCLKGTKFIRIIKKRCPTRLRLPSRLGRNVAEFLQKGAILYAHRVHVTQVQVVHSNGGCSFAKGWAKFCKRFCKRYKVAKGCVLMFEYLGHSAFKVEIFNGRTGLVADKAVSGARNGADAEHAAEDEVEKKQVGRPRVVYHESEEVGHVELYGMKLRKFTMYNLRAKLRRRKLTEDGCKGELVERLGRFIMRHGEDYHFERIRFENEWRWL